MNNIFQNEVISRTKKDDQNYPFPNFESYNNQIGKNIHKLNIKNNINKNKFTKDIFKNNQSYIQEEKSIESEQNDWYKKGYNDGLKEVISNEKVKITSTLKHLERTIDELNDLKNKTIEDLEKQIPMLSIAIAKKIIQREVGIDTEIIQSILHKILYKINDSDEIKIHINPLDYKNLKKNDINLIELKGVNYIKDSSISLGGCLIETNIGKIDARIEKRINMIEEAFNTIKQKY